MVVLLPLPVAPTMATDSPGFTVKETSLSTGFPSSYAKPTSENAISGRSGKSVRVPEGNDARVSKRVKTRSAAANALCRAVILSLNSRKGRKKSPVYQEKATKVPKETELRKKKYAPAK